MAKLIITMGIQGSGKSTFIQNQLQDTDKWVSRDLIRFNLLEDNEDYFKKEKQVVKQFMAEIEQGLKDTKIKRVFADALNISKKSRAKIINRFRNLAEEIEIVWVQVPLDTAIARNEKRTGRAKLDKQILIDCYNRLEEPTEEEGAKICKVDWCKEL